MPTTYVYSPVTGIITGRTKYCVSCSDGDTCTGSGNNHGACSCCGGSSPVDVDTSDNGAVRFYSNSAAVKSFRTLVYASGCCSPCGNGDINRTIKVQMYGFPDGTCYIGGVVYAHIANPQVIHNTLYIGSSKLLGYAPGGNCGCYAGSHSHIERIGGSNYQIPCCCNQAYAGVTAFYTWPNCAGLNPDDEK